MKSKLTLCVLTAIAALTLVFTGCSKTGSNSDMNNQANQPTPSSGATGANETASTSSTGNTTTSTSTQ